MNSTKTFTARNLSIDWFETLETLGKWEISSYIDGVHQFFTNRLSNTWCHLMLFWDPGLQLCKFRFGESFPQPVHLGEWSERRGHGSPHRKKHGMNQFEWNWEPPGNGRLRWGSPLSGRNNNKKTIHKCTIYTPQLHHTPNIMIYHGILQTPHFATFTQKKHPSLRNCCLRPHRHHSEACQFLLFHANSFSCWCRHHLPTVPPRPELVENDPQPARLRVQKGKLWNYLEAVYRDSAKPSEH